MNGIAPSYFRDRLSSIHFKMSCGQKTRFGNAADSVVNGRYDLVNLFAAKLDLKPFIDAWGTSVSFELSAYGEYYFGSDLFDNSAQSGFAGVEKDESIAYPAYDANGNITEYVSGGGEILSHSEYSSFGWRLCKMLRMFKSKIVMENSDIDQE